MTNESQDWLQGWTVVEIGSCRTTPSVYSRYSEECMLMQRAGIELFSLGTLPELTGTSAPAAFQSGTGGNFAIRRRSSPGMFVVTARGAHKGHLRNNSFVEVAKVSWRRRTIYIRRDSDDALPSTDTLLVATAFEAHPEIVTWVHLHQPVATPNAVRLTYPSLTTADHRQLALAIKKGLRIINMIDHNLFIKKAPNGASDATIIVGTNPQDTFELAIKSIRRSTP
jgi:hypothetical protein